MQNETLISLDLLDEVRTTLAAAFNYHDGLDITESQRKMWPEKRNSNLTLEVQATLAKVEELVAQHVMRERDERRQRRVASAQAPDSPVDTHSVEIEFEGELDPVMCSYDEHEIDVDGYCVYCGYDEDEIEREQSDDGTSVDDAADSE